MGPGTGIPQENEDFVQNIMADIATLGIKPDVVTYTSDHFEPLLAMGRRLLAEGKAYVDDTPVERMRQERGDGIESACRGNSVEKNLAMWDEMARTPPLAPRPPLSSYLTSVTRHLASSGPGGVTARGEEGGLGLAPRRTLMRV